MIFETEKTYAKRLSLDTAKAVSDLSKDDDNRRFMPDEVFETEECAREVIVGLIDAYEKGGPYVFSVFLKADDTQIGHVELVPIEDGKFEIGYHIAKEYAGRGYATEAVKGFLPFIKSEYRLSVVYGICRVENAASQRVLEKCDFKRIFEGEDARHFGGKPCVVYEYNF